MDLDISGLLHRAAPRNGSRECKIERNSLIIDCNGCQFVPQPGSKECLRCMVDCMSSAGSAERVILRTGMDMEVSGRSGEVIRRIASMKRWSTPPSKTARGCSRCETSRSIIIRDLWESFPGMDFSESKSGLTTDGHDDRCSRCVQSSLRAVDQLESDLDAIRRGMLR